MKKIKSLTFLLFLALISCENDNEKFSGSPEGNLEIQTITGDISANVENNFALPGQEIDFTVTIPQSFRSVTNDTLIVEATTLTKTGSKRTTSIIIPENTNTATGKITVGGSSIFQSQFDLFLSAINVKNNSSGVHYLLDSNKLTFNTGNSSIPSNNDKRLQIRVSWENLLNGNNVRCFMKNSSNFTFNFGNGTEPRTSKSFFISNSQLINSAGNPINESLNSQYAFNPSEYTLSISATSATDLETNPTNLKYRVVVKFPNNDVKIFNGVYNNMTNDGVKLDILKFTKMGIDETSDYIDFVNLNP